MTAPRQPGRRPGRRGDLFDPTCSTRGLLDRIGDKWTSMLVKVLAEASPEPMRFNEIRRTVPGISNKMLSQTLQSMVADGLAERTVVDTVPPQVSYRLTPLGMGLEVPLAALREWAEVNMPRVSANRAKGGG